jgi:phosphoribosylanthranilate isomerase
MDFWNNSNSRKRVKICNIKSLEVGAILSELKPDALGFHLFQKENFVEKTAIHKRSLTYLGNHISKWLLTDIKDNEQLRFIINELKIDVIQLQREYSVEEVIAISDLIDLHSKQISLVKSISTANKTLDDIFSECLEFQPICKALLLDTSESGGSGELNNLPLCAQVISKVKIPVFLAGGLTALNVRQAINEVNPFGVDVESGVEEVIGYDELLNKKIKVKSFRKAHEFINAVRTYST